MIMNPTSYDKENLNALVSQLKEKEINNLRLKIANLSREITLYPQETSILINLNTSLIRLDQLMNE